MQKREPILWGLCSSFSGNNQDMISQAQKYAEEGLRVLVLAHSPEKSEGTELPKGLEPVAFLLLTDVIREEAPDTLKFFDSQEVDLKVISGDDPVTVAAIARRAGLKMQISMWMQLLFSQNRTYSVQFQSTVYLAVSHLSRKTDGSGT